MRPTETGGDKKRLAALCGLLQVLRGFPANEAVPCLAVVRFEHDAALALLPQNLLLRGLFRCAVFYNVDIPGARVLELFAGMKNLADLDCGIAVVAKMLRQHWRIFEERPRWRLIIDHTCRI